jgi:DnaJ-class molecular chaperone
MTLRTYVRPIGFAIGGEVIMPSETQSLGLPDLYSCPDCHGTGVRSEAMTPSQRRERNRELRRAKAQKRVPVALDITCLTCAGKGVSDRPFPVRMSMPPDWANDDH